MHKDSSMNSCSKFKMPEPTLWLLWIILFSVTPLELHLPSPYGTLLVSAALLTVSSIFRVGFPAAARLIGALGLAAFALAALLTLTAL